MNMQNINTTNYAIKLIITIKKSQRWLFLFCPESYIFLLNIDDWRLEVNKRNLKIANKSFFGRMEAKMIKTVGELRKILNDLDDNYKLDVRMMKEIPEKELIGRSYPYPREMIDGYLDFQDIGYSDKELCIDVYEK